MALRVRETTEPGVALARQRAENDLSDMERARRGRLNGLDRLTIVRHGPVRYPATAIVRTPKASSPTTDLAPEHIDPDIR